MNNQKETQEPKSAEPLSEYPTAEQAEFIFNAWKLDGKEGIRRALNQLYHRGKPSERPYD